MARYYKLVIERTIKIQDPLPDNCTTDVLEDEVAVEYPFDCEETDGSVTATLIDAD